MSPCYVRIVGFKGTRTVTLNPKPFHPTARTLNPERPWDNEAAEQAARALREAMEAWLATPTEVHAAVYVFAYVCIRTCEMYVIIIYKRYHNIT